MAQSLQQVKSRIHSVRNIRKVTRAMEMVSLAKLRPLQKGLVASKDYFLQMDRVLNNLLTSFNVRHPLLEERADKKNLTLWVITSDTGLCASYNNTVIHLAEDFISKNSAYKINLVIMGKKGLNHFRKSGFVIADSYLGLYGHYSSELSNKIANSLIDMFLTGKTDEAHVVYTNFGPMGKQGAVIEKILNITAVVGTEAEYLTEPGIDNILEEILPLYISSKAGFIIMSAFTAEHSIRVMAMNEATDKAKELLDNLVLLRNKMRQANITRELIEVISSADALKG